MSKPNICDACETVAHCMRNGCVPVTQAVSYLPEQQAPQRTRAREIAVMDGYRASATDAYFAARPQIDSLDRRRVYEAGYLQGWDDYLLGRPVSPAAPGGEKVEQPGGGRAELPPLPKAVREMIKTHQPAEHNEWTVTGAHYTADQMRDYARAAILAADAKVGAEPVAWADPETLARVIPGSAVPATLSAEKVNRFTTAIYTHPPAAQKPLTGEQVAGGVVSEKCGLASGQFPDIAFMLGVRFAERAHGITGKEQQV